MAELAGRGLSGGKGWRMGQREEVGWRLDPGLCAQAQSREERPGEEEAFCLQWNNAVNETVWG